MTIVINFFAGPGAGKSSMSAALFAALKFRGINCELATEYAKDKVWEESFGVFHDQVYIFGKQLHRIRRLLGKVEVIITDSPILMSLYYGKNESETFKRLVLEEHNRVNSLNVLLVRKKPYEPKGRMQTEDEAKGIDVEMRKLLEENQIPYIVVDGVEDRIHELADLVCAKLSKPQIADES